MIRSMTAFARFSAAYPAGQLTWEVRSVNHRYLDVNFKLPDSFRGLEVQLRQRLTDCISRGKVDCSLRFELGADAPFSVDVNTSLAQETLTALRKFAKQQQLSDNIGLADVTRWPGVISQVFQASTELNQQVLVGFDNCLAQLNDSRAVEGEKLKAGFLQRIELVEQAVRAISEHYPVLIEQKKQRLLHAIAEAELKLSAERLEQEVVILLQKSDIAEELDRLASHIDEAKRLFNQGAVIGRRLDFLLQEFNREANTLAAKSAGTAITHQAIDIKVATEQMREQIQNIE